MLVVVAVTLMRERESPVAWKKGYLIGCPYVARPLFLLLFVLLITSQRRRYQDGGRKPYSHPTAPALLPWEGTGEGERGEGWMKYKSSL